MPNEHIFQLPRDALYRRSPPFWCAALPYLAQYVFSVLITPNSSPAIFHPFQRAQQARPFAEFCWAVLNAAIIAKTPASRTRHLTSPPVFQVAAQRPHVTADSTRLPLTLDDNEQEPKRRALENPVTGLPTSLVVCQPGATRNKTIDCQWPAGSILQSESPAQTRVTLSFSAKLYAPAGDVGKVTVSEQEASNRRSEQEASNRRSEGSECGSA
jgi:hypothetical protein